MQTIIKRRPNRFQRFHETLQLRGYASYDAYLASDEWREFNIWYRRSGLPTECLVCGSGSFVLHHWNYVNVGHENPCDVIPLCDDHHHQLHAWLHKSGGDVSNVVEHLTKCFGLSAREADQKFKPFREMVEMAARARVERCATCGRRKGDYETWIYNCWPCRRREARALRGSVVKAGQPQAQPKPRLTCSKCRKVRRPESLAADGICKICHRKEARRISGPQPVPRLHNRRAGWPLVAACVAVSTALGEVAPVKTVT